ncbi:MAG: flagellin, partial [Paenibacillus sp.]|nr:flagellin [Paenibacillus sp.]
LLNGSLSGEKIAQGTEVVSALVDQADIPASSATAKAGFAVPMREATPGQAGKGYTVLAGEPLVEPIHIQTGINDKFNITVNSTAYSNVTIPISPARGYTQAEFVQALNGAVQARVGADWVNELSQAVFQAAPDGRLAVTTVATGGDSSISITLSNPATNDSAMQTMGMSAKAPVLRGSVMLPPTITLAAVEANNDIRVTLGNTTIAVNPVTHGGLTAGNTYAPNVFLAGLQEALDNQFGKDNVKVNIDNSKQLVLTTSMATGTFSVQNGAAGTFAADFIGGSPVNATTLAPVSNVNIQGTDTIIANKGGTYVGEGVNDQFLLRVNGAEPQTITLHAGTYAPTQKLLDEINNQIGTNPQLANDVFAFLNEEGKITFATYRTGAQTTVEVADPNPYARTALGVIGFAGSAGDINSNASFIDISSGVDLTTLADRKFNVTLGNKTVTLDLSNQKVNQSTAPANDKTSRDAIVIALQAEINAAFGEGALTVKTASIPPKEVLAISSNTRVAKFEISNPAGGNGATALFAAATVGPSAGSASAPNEVLAGTDAIMKTISNDTLLSEVADADGNLLNLQAGNVIRITGSQNGEGFETAFTVEKQSTVGDLLGALRKLEEFREASVALDLVRGKIVITGATGETKDVSGLTFEAQQSTTSTLGVSPFNRVFGSFDITRQAQNKSSDNSLTMQIGANQGQKLKVDINNLSTGALRLSAVDISAAASSQAAIGVISSAVEFVSTERAKLGAIQNRLEHTIHNLGTSSENLTASESRIRDVDMAKEMLSFTKDNILSQAAQAMLAQANQQPQGVLQLLK